MGSVAQHPRQHPLERVKHPEILREWTCGKAFPASDSVGMWVGGDMGMWGPVRKREGGVIRGGGMCRWSPELHLTDESHSHSRERDLK